MFGQNVLEDEIPTPISYQIIAPEAKFPVDDDRGLDEKCRLPVPTSGAKTSRHTAGEHMRSPDRAIAAHGAH